MLVVAQAARNIRSSFPTVTALVIGHARTGLNYSDFAVVTEEGSFGTTRQVASIVKDLLNR